MSELSFTAMARKARITLALLAVLSTLSGCWDEKAELNFDSVAVVALRDKPDSLPWIRAKENVDKGSILLLEVVISSATDLVRLAKSAKIHIGYSTYLCDSKDASEIQVYSPTDLMVGNTPLGDIAYYHRENLDDVRGPTGRIAYHIVIPLDGEEIRRIYPSQAVVPLYNAESHLEDICIHVRGGAMWLKRGFSTNRIVVPHSAVLKAIGNYSGVPK